MSSPPVYVDHTTAGRPSEKAIAAMTPFFTELWGNPLAPHDHGAQLLAPIEQGYRTLYQLLGADEKDTFVFTASGAEAVNQVIMGNYIEITCKTGKSHFVTSQWDEAPAMMGSGRLEQLGGRLQLAPVNRDGVVTAQAVTESLSPRTAFVSLSWVNGLTGVIQPIEEIAEVCHSRGVFFHVDITHGLGAIRIDLEELGADAITFHGAQLHAPMGTGGLLLREGKVCPPLILGGQEQGGLRGGGFPTASFIALATAAEEASYAIDFVATEVARLRENFEQRVTSEITGAEVLFVETERVPHISSIYIPGVNSEALLFMLNQYAVYATIGGGEQQQLSALLTISGASPQVGFSSISFGFSRMTTQEEIDRVVEVLVTSVHHLRHLSGFPFPFAEVS